MPQSPRGFFIRTRLATPTDASPAPGRIHGRKGCWHPAAARHRSHEQSPMGAAARQRLDVESTVRAMRYGGPRTGGVRGRPRCSLVAGRVARPIEPAAFVRVVSRRQDRSRGWLARCWRCRGGHQKDLRSTSGDRLVSQSDFFQRVSRRCLILSKFQRNRSQTGAAGQDLARAANARPKSSSMRSRRSVRR